MKTLFCISLFITGIFFCGCSTKDDVILAAPDKKVDSIVVASSSSNETKPAVSAVELENRFKGCKAHW